MTPARILFLNPTAQLGGAEYSLLDLAASLDRRRFVPLIACLGDGPLMGAAKERGVEAVSLQLPARFARLSLKGSRSSPLAVAGSAISVAPIAWRVRQLASTARILHTNGNKAHVLGAIARGSARLLWHVRDFWRTGRFERTMVRLANVRADAVIANSAAVAAHLTGMGVRASLVTPVPNGIDGERFTPDGEAAPLRAEYNLPPGSPLVGIVGMLARWKGHDVLLRAFADVLRRRRDARCVVAGDEIYVTSGQTGVKNELQQLARELNIEHAVIFAGYRRDIPALLRSLDVVVHASVEPEPFGRVVAEGMACARPVIATNAGGVPEVTGPSGTCALLVPPRDVGAMAQAIERLLADRAEAGRLAAAGRERIVANFGVARHVDQMQSIYERLLR